MTVRVDVHVDELESVMATYAEIRLERAATPTGFLADGTSEIAQITLVEGQADYAYADPDGLVSDWYRSRYADGAGALFSAYSVAIQGTPLPLVSLDRVLLAVGVTADTPEADRVGRLLDAVSAQIRRMTKRAYEGTPTTYDEVYRLEGSRWLRLRHGPVLTVESIRTEDFAGELSDPWEATSFRVESVEHGQLRLGTGVRFARVAYTTTGEIPPHIAEAAEEWVKARWEEGRREHGLAGYSTGSDSEQYNATIAGKMPGSVARTIAGAYSSTAGGPV